jgi:hypothetical protein
MILIGRPIEGISLNGLEYLMNDDNTDYRFFVDKAEAYEFLRVHMPEATDEDLEDTFMFMDTETDFENPEAFKRDETN